MPEVRLKHIQGKTFVDVNATVAQAKKQLQTNNEITLVARQTQISRVGMVIKAIEELQNGNTTQTVKDKQGDRDVSVLYFRATLTKN